MDGIIENETPSDLVVAEINPNKAFDIFVSYRVRNDEELAGELKVLLESAIEPTPRVFISGLGGLRSSALSYREQLQKAARSAKSYVGLITKESVDREWILFEAGAAFGRGVLYAPLLVDVDPGELPPSIGGYQGTKVDDQRRFQEFVDDIAKAIGAKTKLHFGQRFGRFAKAVAAYGKAESSKELVGIDLALSLVEKGRDEEAAQLFDELAEEASSPELKAHLQITKLISVKNDERNLLERLEKLSPNAKETTAFKFWMGVHETNPIAAIQFLREASNGKLGGSLPQMALSSLVRNEFQMGHSKEATDRLLDALCSDDRHLRAVAAQELAVHVGVGRPILSLILLADATLDPSIEHLLEAADFCWTNTYTSIGLSVASTCLSETENQRSHLLRGLLREQAGLISLSFQDFRSAAKHGSSVAKSNMARMLSAGPVAEAGLEILREHIGDFDSSDPGHPYAVRAELERSVANEREIETKLCSHGERVAKAIHRLLGEWRRSRTHAGQIEGRWLACVSDGQKLMIKVTSGNVVVSLGTKTLKVQEQSPLNGFYVAFDGEEVLLFFVVHRDVDMVAVTGLASNGTVEWLELQPDLPG